jgi:hypothetical protein
VPGDQVAALLEKLDRPPAGQAGGDATSVAAVIREALDRAPSNALIEKRFALALLGAIDDVRRAAGLGPKTVALQARASRARRLLAPGRMVWRLSARGRCVVFERRYP